jgi:hypothetical protein
VDDHVEAGKSIVGRLSGLASPTTRLRMTGPREKVHSLKQGQHARGIDVVRMILVAPRLLALHSRQGAVSSIVQHARFIRQKSLYNRVKFAIDSQTQLVRRIPRSIFSTFVLAGSDASCFRAHFHSAPRTTVDLGNGNRPRGHTEANDRLSVDLESATANSGRSWHRHPDDQRRNKSTPI